MKCGTCKFWDETNESLGSCRRHAPRPAVKETTESRTGCSAAWPRTKGRDWCGEWSVKVEMEAQE